ncbi:MAG: sodium:solute symporter family protein [Sedimentisphaerales bacterium]
MCWFDWLIVAVSVGIVAFVGWRTQSHMHSVADFMTGGRAAGRYLLTTSEMMAGMGLISILAGFEVNFNSGFVYSGPWSVLLRPVHLFIALTGFLIYRYRETRVLTMAQLFEVRYSRRFRVFTGFLSAAAGILNYGIFPAVGGRFFVYFCGLPESVSLLGISIPTFAIVMFVTLTIAVILVYYGGQLTILAIDGIQAVLGYLICIMVIWFILSKISFSQIRDIAAAQPLGQSLVNPWDVGKLRDFNVWFWLIGVFGGIYSMMAWQSTQGFNAAAATPLEAKMGRILATFRAGIVGVLVTVIVWAALIYLKHPDFGASAAAIKNELARIANPAIRTQMTVPMTLSFMLPSGLLGAFCALMFFLMVSTDVSCLHSWGSVIVQDVIMPLRKKPFELGQHIKFLRISIASVAVFAFFFSLLFRQTSYIMMFFAVTASIYMAGAGSVIICGLYWSRGTAAGAWAAMLSGAGISLLGFILDWIWQPYLYPWLSIHQPLMLESFKSFFAWLNVYVPSLNLTLSAERFPVNGQWIWAIAMCTAICVYFMVSLVTCRVPFNMQRMLHRGKYGVDDSGQPMPKPDKPQFSWKTFIGLDPDMTCGDRRLTIFVFSYSMFLWLVGMIVLIWNIVPAWRWPEDWWINWILINDFGLYVVVGLIAAVWFSCGTIRDLRRLFRKIASQKQNINDDGRVIGHVSAADVPVGYKESCVTTEDK